ncbi:hypothetical protein EOM39_05780 [Candidatus Gracilibacteria bacterium]|nr:hypothetical protein [Candidatus Gracilibacteria bacterium]
MKKILIITFLLISSISFAYAEGSCSSCTIKDAPSKELQKFIENQKKIMSRIKSKAAGKTDKSSLLKIEEKFTVSINSLLDFDTYYDDFNYILLELFTSVPKEIRRDKTKIENELTKVQNEIERSIKRRYSGVSINSSDICSGIENCEKTMSGTVLDVLTKIAKNNSKILTLYQNSILGQNTKKDELYLVPDTFYQDLINSYNKTTLMSCSQCEGGFFNEMSEKIKKISDNMKSTGNATKYWKDAWNLLTGNVTDAELKKLEKDLLTKELANQGLSKKQSQIILDNLEKFYSKTGGGGYSTENNFVSNTIKSIANSVGIYVDTFSDVISYLKEQDFLGGGQVIHIVATEMKKKDETKAIYGDMGKMYSVLVKEASMQSIVDEKSIEKLITIHTTISKIIQNLEKTVDPAQKVCRDQCSGVGNCNSY